MCSKKTVLLLILTFFNLFKFIAGNNDYSWKVTLKQQLDNLSFNTTDLLSNIDSINLTSFINTEDILPFSKLKKNEMLYDSYEAGVYIIVVEIVDSTGEVNYAVMRSVLLAGGFSPVVELMYSHGGYSMDSGLSSFSVTGSIINHDPLDESMSAFSWYYPMPINKKSFSVFLNIQETRNGLITVSGISKVFHLNLFGVNWDNNDENLAIDATSKPLNLQSSTTIVNMGNKLIISSNEFETSIVKNLPEHDLAVTCSLFNSLLQLSNILLHFTQSGIFGLKHKSQNWIKISELSCPSQISVSIQDLDFVLVTVDNQIYATSQKGNTSDFSFVPVKDSDQKTWCEFLDLPTSQCNIIGHTIPSHKCCMFYLLTYDNNIKKYSVGQYIGYMGAGEWKILHTFDGRIPPSQYKHIPSGFVLLDNNGTNSGELMDLQGIHTLSLSDENLYLFGKVFLVLDIRSCTLLAVQTEQNSILFGNAVVQQMSSATKSRKFSLLTSGGGIWTGKALPNFAGIKLNKVGNVKFASIIAMFFNFEEDLFVLEFDNEKVKRTLMEKHEELEPLLINAVISCPDVTSLARIRKFEFNPPRKWPGKSQENIKLESDIFPSAETMFIPQSENLFALYRVSAQIVYIAQKIGEYGWWADRITGDWYFDLHGFEDYLDYLSVNNLSFEDKPIIYISKYDYALDYYQPDIECSVYSPTKVYLDKGQVFKVEIVLTSGSDNPLSTLANVELFVSLSDHLMVDMLVVKHKEPMQTRFEVIFTGNQLVQLPPGVKLSSIYATLSPWIPKSEPFSDNLEIIIKVGCPPALSLKFDREESVRMLAERGRTDNFECLIDLGDNIPCFTTSEFVTAFIVEDHVSGTKIPFIGNFTLKIVAGGVGYEDNIRMYTDEEIAMYNYRPGDSKMMESLIWSVLDDSGDDKMKDNKTGELIFDSNNPSSIVLECRIDSPCGSIPFGTRNPSEFFFVIETSNKGVDSSTNCDFTSRFTIHLIGIELNPRSHFSIMLVVLSILIILIFLFYQFSDGSGKELWESFMRKIQKEEFAEPPLQMRNIFQKRDEISSSLILQQPFRGTGAKRGSLLVDSLMAEGRTRRKNMAVVADLRRQSMAIRNRPSILLNDEDLSDLDIVDSAREMKDK